MPRYQIELLWKCICPAGQVNRGLSRHCSNCGRPKGPEMEEFFPEDISIRAALQGEKKRQALAGPDFQCKYCNALNSALNKCCTECGCDQETGKKPWMAEAQTATLDVETGRKTFSEKRKVPVGLPAATPQQRVDFEVAQAVHTTPMAFEDDDLPPTGGFSQWKRQQGRRRMLPWLFGIAGVALFGFLMWLVFRTKEASVYVTATHWDRQVFVEQYRMLHREGWDPDIDAINETDLGSRFKETVKVNPHDCNCHTVKGKCHTTKVVCTKNKNGTADCSGGDEVCDPDSEKCDTCYDKKDVYADYYEWDVMRWVYDRTVQHACDEPASGMCNKPSWPSDAEIAPKLPIQERNRREEHYIIVFSERDGSTHDFHPKSEFEFSAHPMKSSARIKYGVAHGVEIMP